MVPGPVLVEPDEGQMGLFGESGRRRPVPPTQAPPALRPDPLRDQLAAIDINALTPLEALNQLAALKRSVE
jgi:hypothetical protein